MYIEQSLKRGDALIIYFVGHTFFLFCFVLYISGWPHLVDWTWLAAGNQVPYSPYSLYYLSGCVCWEVLLFDWEVRQGWVWRDEGILKSWYASLGVREETVISRMWTGWEEIYKWSLDEEIKDKTLGLDNFCERIKICFQGLWVGSSREMTWFSRLRKNKNISWSYI